MSATSFFCTRQLAAALIISTSPQAFAATVFNVNSTDDAVDNVTGDGACRTASGTCTLRAAIMEANHSSGIGVTVNVPKGTYTLVLPAASDDGEASGDLNFNGSIPVTVIGAGRGLTIIDANQIDRVLEIAGGANVTLQSMSLVNGYTSVNGGAIDNSGQLTLVDVDVANSHGLHGGGIDNEYNATLTMRGGSVTGSTSPVGGGIYCSGGNLDLSNVTIAGNSASQAGGVYTHILAGPYGSTLIRNSVISGNSALDEYAGYGGGVELVANATLVNVTIAGNQALLGGAGVHISHEFGSSGGPVNFYNVTISENAGGGILIDPESNYPFNIFNTLIAGNTETNDPLPDECSGNITSHARDLFGDTTGCNISVADGSIGPLNSTAYLGNLANNGGPTQTIALLSGSNAIDGNTGTCVDSNGQPLTTDQRGYPRPFGAGCDIGAYEFSDVIFKNGFQ